MTRTLFRFAPLFWLPSLLLLAACEPTSPMSADTDGLVPRSVGQESENPGRVGDLPIIQGFLVNSSGEIDFRPCNTDDLYVVQTSLAIWDAIESGAFADSNADVQYIRVHGVELERSPEIPATYAGALRIDELLTSSTPPPANCR